MITQWNKLVKQYWEFISLVIIAIAAIFIIGHYYTKINVMSADIQENQKEIKTLTKQYYILLGFMKGKYPAINLQAYIKISTDKQLSKGTIVNTLKALKDKTPEQGKAYLMEQGYSNTQTSAIYSTDEK